MDQMTFVRSLYDKWIDFFQFLENGIRLFRIHSCFLAVCTNLASAQAIYLALTLYGASCSALDYFSQLKGLF